MRNIIFEKVKEEYEDFKDYRYKFDNQISDLISLIQNKEDDKKGYIDQQVKEQLKDAIEYMQLNEKYKNMEEFKKIMSGRMELVDEMRKQLNETMDFVNNNNKALQ